MSHVALATGAQRETYGPYQEADADFPTTGSEILSFWPPPERDPSETMHDASTAGMREYVKRTTIEDLIESRVSDWGRLDIAPALSRVTFGHPRWLDTWSDPPL
jgi:hypothetical protein